MESVELPLVYTRDQALQAGMTRAQLRDDGVRVAHVARAVPLSLEIACRAAHLDAARPESLVRCALISGGLPEPTVQVPVLDG